MNWKRGRDREDVTRQICNGWRADDLIAAQVLSERTGRIAARLGGYRGTRMLQDNCLWKPPGTKSLGMHQDGSYADYLSPPEMITCWVALDETFAQGGTIEYVRGSHLWPKTPPDRGSFHAPDNWLAPLDGATPDGVEPERVPVVVKPGGCAFHHSLTFHGSGPNESTVERRALVSHLVPVETRFHPTNTDLDLLALPPPRRPLARRVVLPRALGRERRAIQLVEGVARAALTCDHSVTYYPRRWTRFSRHSPTRRAAACSTSSSSEDGQTLSALEKRLPMTRYGVMKHLRVLEEAQPRDNQEARAREAPLPEPRPDPARPRQVGEQVRGALGGHAQRA